MASEDLLVEIDMTQCFSFVVAGIICLLIVCCSPCRLAGSCGKARQGSFEMKTTKEVRMTSEQLVWTILDDDGSIVSRNAKRVGDKQYRKLDACKVKGCAWSKPKPFLSYVLYDLRRQGPLTRELLRST